MVRSLRFCRVHRRFLQDADCGVWNVPQQRVLRFQLRVFPSGYLSVTHLAVPYLPWTCSLSPEPCPTRQGFSKSLQPPTTTP